MTTILTILLYALASVGVYTVLKQGNKLRTFFVNLYHAFQIKGRTPFQAGEYLLNLTQARLSRLTTISDLVRGVPFLGGLLYRVFFEKRVLLAGQTVRGAEYITQTLKAKESEITPPPASIDFSDVTVH